MGQPEASFCFLGGIALVATDIEFFGGGEEVEALVEVDAISPLFLLLSELLVACVEGGLGGVRVEGEDVVPV